MRKETEIKFTRDSLEQWAKENAHLALAVCQAQAFAKCERERVFSYTLPIFRRYSFRVNPKFSHRYGEMVERPADLYLTDEEEKTTAYYAECNSAHREHGFTGPDGHCPALVAEGLQRTAEHVLIESGCELLGIESPYNLDHRRELLRILLGCGIKAADDLGLLKK